MSLLTRLLRYNPLRIVGTVDEVPKLQAFSANVKQTQKRTDRQLADLDARLQQLEQTIRDQQKELDLLPRLRKTLKQYRAAYQSDVKHAARIPLVNGLLNADAVRAHVSESVHRARLELDPCPHIVVEDFLPAPLYDELVAAMPGLEFFDKQDVYRGETPVPFVFAPAYTHAVWDFFYEQVIAGALIQSLAEKFRPAEDELVRTYWPTLDSWAGSGIDLHVLNSRLMVRRPGYEITPHRDPRWAFLTALIYLQKPDAPHSYGTQLYRMKQERESPHGSPFWVAYEECEMVRDVPAAPNRVLVFLNSRGLHAASVPTGAPQDLERYVFQIQYGPDAATKERLIETLAPEARPAWVAERTSGYPS